MSAAFTRLLSRALLIFGALATAFAIVWWWVSFREVYQNDYISFIDASACLVQDSTICRLATSLCRSHHPLAILAYSSNALWIGVAALCASLMTRAAKGEAGGSV